MTGPNCSYIGFDWGIRHSEPENMFPYLTHEEVPVYADMSTSSQKLISIQKKQQAIRMQSRQKTERLATLCVEQQRKIDDTPAVILLENLSDFEELENHILDILSDINEQKGKNFPLLCKQGDNRYVITFPFGVSRLFLYEFADDISVFFTCTLHLWAKSELFKKHCGEWIYLCIGAEDLLVAVTEDGAQWEINPDDAMLHHSKKHDRSYRAFPDLEWSTFERQRFL